MCKQKQIKQIYVLYHFHVIYVNKYYSSFVILISNMFSQIEGIRDRFWVLHTQRWGEKPAVQSAHFPQIKHNV